MSRRLLLIALAWPVVASAASDVKRLSPLIATTRPPAQCRVASILKDTPAERAGIVVGDILESINGQIPGDASLLAELVGAAPEESVFSVKKKEGIAQNVKIRLNAKRPRLGAVCDLTGWNKQGVTAAGNVSVTLFDGPFAMTASGIIDKNIVFLRVRLANDSDHPLNVGPELFRASDGAGNPLAILAPKDVMCLLYGDKGLHLMNLKKRRKDTLDSPEGIPAADRAAEEDRCSAAIPHGKLKSGDAQFAEANAQYLAVESLWPAVYKPGEAADGLLYLREPASLPVTLQGTVEGHVLTAQLSLPQPSDKVMKSGELVAFFEQQKKGNSLRVTLKKGKVFVGKFSSYDEVNERAWFSTPSGGLLNSTSYSVEAIRSAEPLEQVPAKSVPSSSEHLN